LKLSRNKETALKAEILLTLLTLQTNNEDKIGRPNLKIAI